MLNVKKNNKKQNIAINKISSTSSSTNTSTSNNDDPNKVVDPMLYHFMCEHIDEYMAKTENQTNE